MKTRIHVSILTLLLSVCSPCLAMIEIADVNKDRARELDMEIRAQPSGPDAVRVQPDPIPQVTALQILAADLVTEPLGQFDTFATELGHAWPVRPPRVGFGEQGQHAHPEILATIQDVMIKSIRRAESK